MERKNVGSSQDGVGELFRWEEMENLNAEKQTRYFLLLLHNFQPNRIEAATGCYRDLQLEKNRSEGESER